MLGISKPEMESNKFLKYFEMVQQEAGKQNKVFFIDTPDGHDFETDDLMLENIRGWLIPADKANEITPEWEIDEVGDSWYDYMCWAEWQLIDGKVKIEFKFYPS